MQINIEKELVRFINPQNILFATFQSGGESSDTDIYCVCKSGTRAQVHIYKKGLEWVEIFIDPWEDMVAKIKNADEITVSFITRMNFMDGVGRKKYLDDAKKLVKKKYKLPSERKKLLQYRVKTLASKYFSARNHEMANFFQGQIQPHLIILIFEKYGVWPDSPKKWAKQLELIGKPESKLMLGILRGSAKADGLINKLTRTFSGITKFKDKRNNKLTYLG